MAYDTLAPPAAEMSLLVLSHLLHKFHEESGMQQHEGLMKAEVAHRLLNEGRDRLGQSCLCPVDGHRDTSCHWAPDCQEFNLHNTSGTTLSMGKDQRRQHTWACVRSVVRSSSPRIDSDIEPPPHRQHPFTIAAPNKEASGQQ